MADTGTPEGPGHPDQFPIIIVYGSNKPLEVQESEAIDAVKIAAMGLFGIPASDAGHYILRAKQDGKEVQLNEAETVQQAKLHPHEKVTLASGTPYGADVDL